MEVRNRFITIKRHIEGTPKESDFELKAETLDLSSVESGSSYIILKHLYVSIDPYQMNRMKSYSSSHKAINAASPIAPGHVIEARGLAKVVASGNPEFQKDDLVVGLISWGEYSIRKSPGLLTKLDPIGLPLSHHVGILGYSGLTAYAGLFDICKPMKGEKVFVSAACGSVGNLVGQYAKLIGCYVVGCAGSKEKVALLKDRLGFDDAFNYKEETDLKLTLKRLDVFFWLRFDLKTKDFVINKLSNLLILVLVKNC
eukprot:XP_015578029.1 2-alkenal reductase (NADP(+)-dependent) [Ricinus communis]